MISVDTIATILPPPLRGRAGEGGSPESPSRQSARKSLHWILSVSFVLACVPVHANEGEERWRLFEQPDGVLLAASHTDDATDDLGAFLFRCKRGSGTVEVEGSAKQDLRTAMADLIRADGYPQLDLFPIGSGGASLLDLSYSEMSEGWQYSFTLPAVGPAFDEFKRTGQLTFKVGTTVVREEFKTGLESAARFQDICKQRPR